MARSVLSHRLVPGFGSLLATGLLAAALAGCSDEKAAEPAKTLADAKSSDSSDAAATDAKPGDAPAADVPPSVPLPPQDCDDLMESGCALPWPSNLYLVPDKTRKTGHVLAFGAKTLPIDVNSLRIRPDEYRQLDGYSVGTQLLMKWKDLDPTGLPSEASLAQSLDAGAALVLLELDATGKVARKVPWFAEMDLTEPVAADRTLIVRPAEILKPATRYVVGVRGLKTKDGKAIAPSAAFAALRDGKTAGTPNAARQQRFDELLGTLQGQGWGKESLVLAWDFVTNSHEALHGRLLSMREQVLQAIGEQGPALTVTKVNEFNEAQDKDIAVEIHGTFQVPNFLAPRGEFFHRLNAGPNGMPAPLGTVDRPFEVRVPRSALTGKPHGLVQYGHGLNGSYLELEAGYNGVIANTHDLIFYSCYWTGMSEKDVPAIFMLIQDMSEFSVMPDRLHQGMIEFMALQRAMKMRFADLPAVQKLGIKVNKNEMFYSGISQGGIYGGVMAALSKDIERFHLGVPGNNYSTLLQRSTDFEMFFGMVAGNFPATTDQLVLLATIQLLWDQVDPATWYRYIDKEPLPGNAKHQVLIAPAKGDYQVSVMTNEIAARSGFGFEIMKNYGAPVFGVTEKAYPHQGSGIVLYDHGNPWPVPGNLPPLHDKLGDPHGKPRQLKHHQAQMVHFLRTGEIKDFCGGDGCTPD